MTAISTVKDPWSKTGVPVATTSCLVWSRRLWKTRSGEFSAAALVIIQGHI